jgi:heavy metal translocating P-type ATPase
MNVMAVSLLLYTGEAEPEAVPFFRWTLLGLSTPAIVLLGFPFVAGAAGELGRRRVSLDTLIALGSLTAWGMSTVNALRGRGHVYFDTATMLLTLVTVGKLVEASAKRRAGQLLRSLETLLPKRALRLCPEGPEEVELGLLQVGNRLQVRPGERFAVDGTILEGSTTVEEAAFTGEWRSRLAGVGDQVLAGTINGSGAVVVRAARVGEQLLLARIVALVEQARREPAPSERLAQRMAALLVPAVLALAAGSALAWLWSEGPSQAGKVALSIVAVACPCAMGIAAPLASALALGRAAREGAIVRGSDVLERLGQLETLFLDKTGTLTSGRPEVVDLEIVDPSVQPEEALGLLASLESASEHAIARAIVRATKARGIELGATHDVEVTPGAGIRGRVTWRGREREVFAGRSGFLAAMGGNTVEPNPPAALMDGPSLFVEVGWAGRFQARVHLSDPLRPEAEVAVRRLQEAGIETVLLSGDRAETARAIARRLAIERLEAPRSPEEKIAVVRKAQSAPRAVGMAGDGVNDAPALAAADIGIAVGATDLTRQAGNVVLLADDLRLIPWLVHLGRRGRKLIRQNLLWSIGYNGIALAAAAAGLLHPLLAACAMLASSLTVIANSLRLQTFPGPERAEEILLRPNLGEERVATARAQDQISEVGSIRHLTAHPP